MYREIQGFILAIIFTNIFLPQNSGGDPLIKITMPPIFYKSSIIIGYSKRHAIHLHHWIYSLIILLIFYKYLSRMVRGFLFGFMIQGLTYSDAFKVIQINPYNYL